MAAAAESLVRSREEQSPVSVYKRFKTWRTGDWQVRGRAEVRDEQAVRGPQPAMHDEDLGSDREGPRGRSISSSQD